MPTTIQCGLQLLAQAAQLELQVHKVQLEQQAQLEQQVQLERRVPTVPLAQLEHRVQLGQQAQLVQLVQ